MCNPATNRRWLLLLIAAAALSFAGGWLAGRAHLRHEQEAEWAAEEENPFAEPASETSKPTGRDLSKDYLKFPPEQDSQFPPALPGSFR